MTRPMSVRRQLLLALILILAGVGVLALPASLEGPRLVEFGPGHGPSAVDLVGIALLTPGGFWLIAVLVRAMPSLGLAPRVLFWLGCAAGFGLGLLIASAFAGFAGWWAVGAVLLALAELWLVAVTWRRYGR